MKRKSLFVILESQRHSGCVSVLWLHQFTFELVLGETVIKPSVEMKRETIQAVISEICKG